MDALFHNPSTQVEDVKRRTALLREGPAQSKAGPDAKLVCGDLKLIWNHPGKNRRPAREGSSQPAAPLHGFGSNVPIVLTSMQEKGESLMGKDRGCKQGDPLSPVRLRWPSGKVSASDP
ncbi:hypothetical protein AVEN_18671-1 [Araneus ventricosus]|uniref:Uncharacterized protein n=1 Tax=Araneus ventricosus TaxID=182803 RepID=A0A4Y2TQU5_ARAVE|nr:hypothetical protein AVEN_18671-1 [Araneus ventricosus]